MNKEQIRQTLQEYLNDNPVSMSWHREKLGKEEIKMLIEDKHGLSKLSSNLWEYNQDYIWELQNQAKEYAIQNFEDMLREYYQDMGLDPDDYKYHAMDEFGHVIYPDVLLNLKELIKNTKVHINIVTDIQISSCTYHTDYEDVKDLLNFFQVNPVLWNEHLSDPMDMPNIPDRVPLVDPELLLMEWVHTYYHSVVTFTVDMDLWDYVNKREKYQNGITLSKGTSIWMHNSFNGSCSLGEAYLLDDMKLDPDTYRLEVDGQYGYGLDDICGLYDDVWSGQVKV